MPDESLFPYIQDVVAPTPPKDDRSAGAKLRDRRAAWLAAGYHPLANVIRGLRLHRDAAPADDRAALGLRCGGCRNLTAHTVQKTYLKCQLHPSQSDASDVRKWWPACVHYKPLP